MSSNYSKYQWSTRISQTKIQSQSKQNKQQESNKFLLYTKLTTQNNIGAVANQHMKGKKKSTTPKSIPLIKMLNVRTLQPQKQTTMSGQKTYLTIEENVRTFENAETEGGRQELRGRFSFSKKSYNQRMEEHNLSPFSNDGRSGSPRWRKTPEKLGVTNKQEKEVKFMINLKQLQKKKPTKGKVNSARQTYTKKPTIPSNAKIVSGLNNIKQQPIPAIVQKKKPAMKKKKSDKSDKQQKARIEFQNEFLSMMNNRIHKQKITEMSDEEQEQEGRMNGKNKRKPVLEICIQSEPNSDKNNSREDKKIKEKKQLVKTMQLKVMKNIQRDYPNLEVTQKKVICAVIIIQRLWRQRKVKQFFQHYVTPKASLQSSFRDSLKKQNSDSESTMNLLAGHVGGVCGRKGEESRSWEGVDVLRRKKVGGGVVCGKATEEGFLIRQKSEQDCKQLIMQQQQKVRTSVHQQQKPTKQHQQFKLNQKVTHLFQASILPFQNQNQKITNLPPTISPPSMLKFIQCYREIKLSSGTKKQSKSKRNIFSLKQSLSEKCLMQKYYTKIFSDRPEKDKPKNYELFSLMSGGLGNEMLKLNQQSSIELFRELGKGSEYLSPQKREKREEEEEVWVRNETRYGDEGESSGELGKGERDEKKEKSGVKDGLNKKMAVDEILYAQGFFRNEEKDEIKTQKFIQEVIISPKKPLVQQQPPQQDNSCGIVVNKQQLYPTHPQLQPFLQQIKPQYSLKSIQSTSQTILTQLLQQFFTQYLAFQQKQCLVKKHRSSSKSKQQKQKQKKPKLPGIQISKTTITQYLNILIPYILNEDHQQLLKSLQLFHPFTYQKCHRVQSLIYETFQFAQQQQEDDIYWNIITNEGFFACLEEYWKRNVLLTKEQEKFTNFLDLTYKVYNRCITDAFSQLFNKHVLQKVIYPWNCLMRSVKNTRLLFSCQTKSLLNPQIIQQITQEVKQKLLKQSFCYSTTDGKLFKKDRKPHRQAKKQYQFGEVPQQQQLMMIEKLSDEQFTKVMRIADDQFLQDEKELMFCSDERYEICGNLCEAMMEELLKEVVGELEMMQGNQQIGADVQLTKSQQEVFLETNQTLETNYHF